MGVDIPWNVFTEKYDGSGRGMATVLGNPQTKQHTAASACSPEEHESIINQLCNKFIAIDVTQWMFQANARDRLQAYVDDARNDDEFALDRSVISLIFSKVHQLLCYGAHPVVILDGRTPHAKDKCLALRAGSESYGWRSVNPRFEKQKHDVKQIIDAAGIPCIMAPGEGEAMCAALNAAGTVDATITTDVCDAFIFGAQNIIRDVYLNFRNPVESGLSFVTLADVRRSFGLESGGREALTALSLLIGTDYNKEGLRGVGKSHGVAHIQTLLARFYSRPGREPHAPRDDTGFVEFVARQLEAAPDAAIVALKKCTGCLRCFHDGGKKGTRKAHGPEGCMECGTLGLGGCHAPEPGAKVECRCAFHTREKERQIESLKQLAAAWAPSDGDPTFASFSEHYRAVFAEFERERRRADSAARSHSRAALLWSRRPDAATLVALLEAKNFRHELKNGANDVLSKVAKLEVEWALRAGEASSNRAFDVAVKKVKEWPKSGASAANTPADSPGAWQYLVDLKRRDSPPSSAAHAAVHAQCLQYDTTKTVKDPSMRLARMDVVRCRWPRALQAFESKGQGRAAKGAKAPLARGLGGAPPHESALRDSAAPAASRPPPALPFPVAKPRKPYSTAADEAGCSGRGDPYRNNDAVTLLPSLAAALPAAPQGVPEDPAAADAPKSTRTRRKLQNLGLPEEYAATLKSDSGGSGFLGRGGATESGSSSVQCVEAAAKPPRKTKKDLMAQAAERTHNIADMFAPCPAREPGQGCVLPQQSASGAKGLGHGGVGADEATSEPQLNGARSRGEAVAESEPSHGASAGSQVVDLTTDAALNPDNRRGCIGADNLGGKPLTSAAADNTPRRADAAVDLYKNAPSNPTADGTKPVLSLQASTSQRIWHAAAEHTSQQLTTLSNRSPLRQSHCDQLVAPSASGSQRCSRPQPGLVSPAKRTLPPESPPAAGQEAAEVHASPQKQLRPDAGDSTAVATRGNAPTGLARRLGDAESAPSAGARPAASGSSSGGDSRVSQPRRGLRSRVARPAAAAAGVSVRSGSVIDLLSSDDD